MCDLNKLLHEKWKSRYENETVIRESIIPFENKKKKHEYNYDGDYTEKSTPHNENAKSLCENENS